MTDEKASKRGRNNRAKGGGYEREIAAVLSTVFPGAKRSIGQARTGAEVPDVRGTPFWVECGVGSTVTGANKLEQAERDWLAAELTDTVAPVAFTRKPRGETIVTMRLEDWLKLVRRAEKP